jgi:hypothetical protein
MGYTVEELLVARTEYYGIFLQNVSGVWQWGSYKQEPGMCSIRQNLVCLHITQFIFAINAKPLFGTRFV